MQPDMSQLLAQAQAMQQQLAAAQEELAQTLVIGSAGGGMVTATMSGTGDLVSVAIDPSVIDPTDPEMLQDLVVAAVRDATTEVATLAAEAMGPLAGGLGGLGLPGM